MIFNCSLEPFGDVRIDVDLYESICNFFSNQARLPDIEPLFEWIARGDVRLRAISPLHCLPEDCQPNLFDSLFLETYGGTGKLPHKQLIAIARLYLESLGKKVCVQGASACTYGGGWADACVPGEKYFVECGSLRTDKPIRAMMYGETLLVLPYTRIDELPEETLREILSRPPKIFDGFLPDLPLAFELRPVNDEPKKHRERMQSELATKRAAMNILYEVKKGP